MKTNKTKNFIKALLSVFLVVGVIYAADLFNSGDTLTADTMNALVDRINTLENEMANVYTKTEIDQKISNSDGIVTRRDTTSGTSCSFSTSQATCTVENLTIGKPLYMMLDTRENTAAGSILYYRVTAGTEDANTDSSNIAYMLSAHAPQNGPWGAGSSAIFVPTNSTFGISLWTHNTEYVGKVYFYQ